MLNYGLNLQKKKNFLSLQKKIYSISCLRQTLRNCLIKVNAYESVCLQLFLTLFSRTGKQFGTTNAVFVVVESISKKLKFGRTKIMVTEISIT